jgi:hypothetical protein
VSQSLQLTASSASTLWHSRRSARKSKDDFFLCRVLWAESAVAPVDILPDGVGLGEVRVASSGEAEDKIGTCSLVLDIVVMIGRVDASSSCDGGAG